MLLQLVIRKRASLLWCPAAKRVWYGGDLYVSRSPRLCPSSLFSTLPLPQGKKNVVNGSSLPLTEPTWADLTGLPVSFVWQSSMKRAQKLWGRKKKKKKKKGGGGGLQKCSTLTPLKHVFLKLGCHLFLNYPLILSSVVSFSRVCRRLGCPVFS